ncbi:MAG TPA: fumarylacetoacetate hydrolase family protein [Ktedonobacteraceae bacterium]|nr:fumarylacetoacetate hydrolase family protein [Ktedonobacteraceae bacterium]
MQFVVYEHPLSGGHSNRLGIIDADVVTDVTDLVNASGQGPDGPLVALLEHGYDPTLFTQARIANQPQQALDQVSLQAPLPRPGKIIGAPVNYLDHKAEMSVTQTIADLGIFLKANSSVIGPGGLVRLPYLDKRTDQEAELAVVIGRTARNISAGEALDYVFGYTCALDITVRSTEDRSTRKSFDTFTPLGPSIVTTDEIGDPHNLELRCWVNGVLRQQGNTRDLIFDVANLIAYTSSVMTLWPGDVFLTGTPAGVGPITEGDQVTVGIEKIGKLTVTVSSEGAIPYDARPGPLHIRHIRAQ